MPDLRMGRLLAERKIVMVRRSRCRGLWREVYARVRTLLMLDPFSGQLRVIFCQRIIRSRGISLYMGLADVQATGCKEGSLEPAVEREELVRRVASSITFEKSPRLRAFFLHVSRCALDNKPEAATEQQVGICVYDRQPGYNPNEDNIVRSQARLLRMKLEHHFANEGKDEAIIITIPKGRYLPVFEARCEEPAIPARPPAAVPGKPRRLLQIVVGVAVLFGFVIFWLGYLLLESKSRTVEASVAPAGLVTRPERSETVPSSTGNPVALPLNAREVRIAAGHTGVPYVDSGGDVGKLTFITKAASTGQVRGISSRLWRMRACSEPCGKPSPPI